MSLPVQLPVIENLEFIFKEVIADRGQHGDFLKEFGRAFVRADYENKLILFQAAVDLVDKYKLHDYMHPQ